MSGDGSYELPTILKTVAAWENHKANWLKDLRKSGQEVPTEETMANFRNIWVAGFLAGSTENQ